MLYEYRKMENTYKCLEPVEPVVEQVEPGTRGVNEPRQLASYSRLTRSKLDSVKTRLGQNSVKTRLG